MGRSVGHSHGPLYGQPGSPLLHSGHVHDRAPKSPEGPNNTNYRPGLDLGPGAISTALLAPHLIAASNGRFNKFLFLKFGDLTP